MNTDMKNELIKALEANIENHTVISLFIDSVRSATYIKSEKLGGWLFPRRVYKAKLPTGPVIIDFPREGNAPRFVIFYQPINEKQPLILVAWLDDKESEFTLMPPVVLLKHPTDPGLVSFRILDPPNEPIDETTKSILLNVWWMIHAFYYKNKSKKQYTVKI